MKSLLVVTAAVTIIAVYIIGQMSLVGCIPVVVVTVLYDLKIQANMASKNELEAIILC